MSRELKGFCIIMLCYLLGVMLSHLIGGFITGSVLGMLILFVSLQMKIVDEENIKGICNFVLNNMMALFVPVTSGLIVSYHALSGGIVVAAVIALTLSTIIVLVVVALVQKYIGKRWRR